MVEAYPGKALSRYVGEFCSVDAPKSCMNYATFAVRSFGTNGDAVLVCAHHLPQAINAAHVLEQRAAVVQEIPNTRASILLLADGKLMRIQSTSRKEIGKPE